MQDLPLKAKQWIRMVIANKSREEILMQVFGVDLYGGNARAINNCDSCMSRWKRHPNYEREWNKAWRERWGKISYKAMEVLEEGMEDTELPWRRTQSANLAMSYAQKNLLGDEATTLKVQITGMPEIGSPDVENGNS